MIIVIGLRMGNNNLSSDLLPLSFEYREFKTRNDANHSNEHVVINFIEFIKYPYQYFYGKIGSVSANVFSYHVPTENYKLSWRANIFDKGIFIKSIFSNEKKECFMFVSSHMRKINIENTGK